jgi:hypothetical protein
MSGMSLKGNIVGHVISTRLLSESFSGEYAAASSNIIQEAKG